ncbi:MAG: hypothetical protein LBC67_04825 [Spirochaetales bacterium]|jgi:hypothetical protein|nr:hypothetical protein [Spirochaetales bacterium]
MKQKSVLLLCAFLFILLSAFPLGAADMGLILDQSASYTRFDGDGSLVYSGSLIPWFSVPLGESGDFYFSASATRKYENEKWFFIPELFRTEFEWRFSKSTQVKLGRFQYTDPLGFIAAGLFDGLQFSQVLGNGVLSLGGWYTGFLFKKTAEITLTPEDLASYHSELDYGNFSDTYFASRRVFAALGYEHPAIAEKIRLKTALLGQLDLNSRETEEAFNSAYFALKLTVPLGASFFIDAGGAVEGSDDGVERKLAFAGEGGLSWLPPTEIKDKLSLMGRFTSGVQEGSSSKVTAFSPLTTETQGIILEAKLSGLSALHAVYTARLVQALAINLSAYYFIRTDKGTYQGWLASNEGYRLGAEFFGTLIWSPVSDLRVQVGGGAFLPSLGDTAPSEPLRWKILANVVLVLY